MYTVRFRSCEEEDGFTLVEILVVIIIIGILAAIAIPIFLNQRKTANDAALASDLRNMAGQITTLDAGKGAAELISDIAHPSGGIAVVARGKNTVDQFGANKPRWENNLDKLPPVALSNGTIVEVSATTEKRGSWEIHKEGEFCLSGSNRYSNYDFVPGSTDRGALGYADYLYYDVKAGGIRTMDELVTRVKGGGEVSCTGYVVAYMKATVS